MRDFDYVALKNKLWDVEVIGYVAALHEAKGKQDAYLNTVAYNIDKLIEIAKVQSTQASNAIEGIRTTDTRLKQLLSVKTTPKNRVEEEIAGYRDALNVIRENYDYISITPNCILQLHKILYKQSGKNIGGSFKIVQNYISATDSCGKTFNLFTPLAPYETPSAIERICEQFNIAIADSTVDPLILIPIFIHDFLCIHPFLDGNGRMSRLLTTLLLYKCGYLVGKYVSLEAKIAKDKYLYYDALEASQIGWHEGTGDPNSFIKYLLGTVISAYRDLDDRINIVSSKTSAFDMVRKAVQNTIGKFKKSDIVALCPSISASSIEVALKKLVENGDLARQGLGKNTIYIRTN